MADFSFLRGNDFQLPETDIYAPYKQALTLRQLADAREYQRAQTERARLQAMQERQEMAEMESFRREYKPGMAPDEVMRRWPTYGPKALTAQGQALTQQRLAETQKRLEEEAKARLEKAAAEKQEKIRQQVANIGMQAAGLPNQPQGTRPDFADLSPREQFFNTQVASALIDQGITPAEQFGGFQMPQDMAAAKRAYGAAYGADKLQTYEAGEQTRKNTALEILGKQWEDVSRRLEGVKGQPSWTKLLGELPPEIAGQFKAEFSPPELARAKRMALSAAQRQQGQPNTADELILWMEQPERTPQEKATAAAQLEKLTKYHTAIRPSVVTAAPGLVDAVLQNPNLWDNLTPTARTEIAPEIAKRGGADIFGKPLSEGAINKLSGSRSAIASLRDLREVLKANEQYIGPLSGLQALNPYSEGKKAQADIDRVRQRVGKELEGGVLRKEDEAKYQKILATLLDVPSTALYKVDRLIESMEKDNEIFLDEQKKAGRRVSAPEDPAKPKASDIPNPLLNAPSSSGGIPKVGDVYQGSRVRKVTKVK